METGSEITAKIRSAIKAKLVELGAYVDEELPDYIMVMIANKKTKEQMTNDLNLFLGKNSAIFTDWVHGVLDRLQAISQKTATVRSSDKSPSREKDSSGAAKRKAAVPPPTSVVAISSSTSTSSASTTHASKKSGDHSEKQRDNYFSRQNEIVVTGSGSSSSSVRPVSSTKSSTMANDNNNNNNNNSSSSGKSTKGFSKRDSSTGKSSRNGTAGGGNGIKKDSASSSNNKKDRFRDEIINEDDHLRESGATSRHSAAEQQQQTDSRRGSAKNNGEKKERRKIQYYEEEVGKKSKIDGEDLKIKSSSRQNERSAPKVATTRPSKDENRSPIRSSTVQKVSGGSTSISLSNRTESTDNDKGTSISSSSNAAIMTRQPFDLSSRLTNRQQKEYKSPQKIGTVHPMKRKTPSPDVTVSPTHKRRSIIGQVVHRQMEDENYEIEEMNKRGLHVVNSTVRVTEPKMHVPTSMQPKPSIFLKALSEANASVSKKRQLRLCEEEEIGNLSKGKTRRIIKEELVSDAGQNWISRPISTSNRHRILEEDSIEMPSQIDEVGISEQQQPLQPNTIYHSSSLPDEYVPTPIDHHKIQVESDIKSSLEEEQIQGQQQQSHHLLQQNSSQFRPSINKTTMSLLSSKIRDNRRVEYGTSSNVCENANENKSENNQEQCSGTEYDSITPSTSLNSSLDVILQDTLVVDSGEATNPTRFFVTLEGVDTSFVDKIKQRSRKNHKKRNERRFAKESNENDDSVAEMENVDDNDITFSASIATASVKNVRDLVENDDSFVKTADQKENNSDEASSNVLLANNNNNNTVPVVVRSSATSSLADSVVSGILSNDENGSATVYILEDNGEEVEVEGGEDDNEVDFFGDEDLDDALSSDNVSSSIGQIKPVKICLDDDEDDHEKPIPQQAELIIVAKENMVSLANNDLPLESVNEKSKERCKYWPVCNSIDSCPFYHPSIPCKAFPTCRFGDRCLYIHPKCRYDAFCSNKRCPFSHSNPSLRFQKPEMVVPKTIIKTVAALKVQPCKFGSRCANPSCPFRHPKLCSFGLNCLRPDCLFFHPQKRHAVTSSGALTNSKVQKFKWVAPTTSAATNLRQQQPATAEVISPPPPPSSVQQASEPIATKS